MGSVPCFGVQVFIPCYYEARNLNILYLQNRALPTSDLNGLLHYSNLKRF